MKKIFAPIALLTFIIITSPLFFEIYRTAAFNTVPRDDYAPFLLSLLGKNYEAPGAPFAYRILSVIAAIPFYYVLPLYSFTNLTTVDPIYLRASQALSFLSYASLVLTAIMIYMLARKKYRASGAASFAVACVSFLLSGFISRTGVDPLAIFIISLLLFFIDRPKIFTPLILISVGINEKIIFIFLTILIFRYFFSRKQKTTFNLYVQLGAACMAAATYFLIVFLVHVPGNEGQTAPALFMGNLISSLALSFSIKGIFLNVLPVLVLVLILVLVTGPGLQRSFHISDVSALVLLLLLSMIIDVAYNVGRIAMYSYPLYLPAAAVFFDNGLGIVDGKDE